MAGEREPYDDPALKGLSRYFNNKTIKGRANVSKPLNFLIDHAFSVISPFLGIYGHFCCAWYVPYLQKSYKKKKYQLI